RVSPATDVYALGAMLYEMLTGRPPFVGVTSLQTLEQVRTQDPVAPTRLRADVPGDLETICLKCLFKEPARRYATALAHAEDLRRFRNGESIQARPVGAGERALKWVRRRPAVAALLTAVVLVLILAFAGGTWLWHRADHRRGEAETARREAEWAQQA